jgi:DNA-binding GntR family transcriptional regulator
MNGNFPAGHAITVRAAAALGRSPMPVRGALRPLEAECALIARDRRGTLMIPPRNASELEELRDIRVPRDGSAANRTIPADISAAPPHKKPAFRSTAQRRRLRLPNALSEGTSP